MNPGSAISKKGNLKGSFLDDLKVERSEGTTPVKQFLLRTPQKGILGSKVQDSILMLESMSKLKPEESDFATVKNAINNQMKELRKDSLEVMVDLFRG